MVDLKTIKKTEEIEDWTKLTLYGLNIFEQYNDICLKIEDFIKEELKDEIEGDFECQEVYLGYFGLEEHSFISGWDLFTDEGGKSCIVDITFTEQGFKINDVCDVSNDIFYAKGSLYSITRRNPVNRIETIDLRLD